MTAFGAMMDRDDEYRRNATRARQSASRAKTDDERANWLRLAEGWLGLIRKVPQSNHQASDLRTARRGSRKPGK
jgi:hypothetical protein